jgi:hypothetical protein
MVDPHAESDSNMTAIMAHAKNHRLLISFIARKCPKWFNGERTT